NQRAILIEGDEGPAEVIKLRHEALHWRGLTPMVPFPRRSPHSIYACCVGIGMYPVGWRGGSDEPQQTGERL
ncbi:MAG TPA: hypothetical protein VHT52_00670, partial [Stellaceae bacterium]|nr:hypothetical protein [Stellaceae bacterium]